MATEVTAPLITYLFPELGISVKATDMKAAEAKAKALTKENK